MSEIIKAEAFVLSKIDYGDTSKVANIFTDEVGKISVIIKGARSPKSKFGVVIDPLNHIRVVFYNKESRDLQLVSDAETINYFPRIKEDIEKLRYSYAVLELINKLIPEHEPNRKLFNAIEKILSRVNASNEEPSVTFGRFFLFFLKEIGFELQLDKCPLCGKNDFQKAGTYYSFDKGVICGNCKEKISFNFEVKKELFNYLRCLITNNSAESSNENIFLSALKLMEDHLKYHIPGFKGIDSLTIL